MATQLLYEDETTCKHGHDNAKRYAIQTDVKGARAALVVDCEECDRSRCYSCKRPLPRTATFCSCSGPTWRREDPPSRGGPLAGV